MKERFIKNLLLVLKSHRDNWELYDVENYLKQELKVIKEREKLMNDVKEILPNLTPREQKILEMRFGFNGNFIHTLEEVAKVFMVTRERIRQIEGKALSRVRQSQNSRYWQVNNKNYV